MSKQTVKTIAAIALLGAGATVLSRSLWPADELPADGVELEDELEIDDMPPMDDDGGESLSGLADVALGNEDVSTRLQADLLALYGSLDSTVRVREAFGAVANFAKPSPSGESVRIDAADFGWGSRPDPVEMHVSMTLITNHKSFACVDGVAVEVGDEVSAGRIIRITPEGIQVQSTDLTLFYEVRQPYPREFQSELARRTALESEQGDEASAEGGENQ